MNQETKICQNCKENFVIDASDFAFYEKIKVPPPTFCPDCRFIRRFTWRNERNLYKRKCGLCNKGILSVYSPGNFELYCPDCWWSDKWDPLKYGQDYDFSKPFFTQYRDILYRIPIISLWGFNNVNCDFASYIGYSKNCYFSFSIVRSEDVYYSTNVDTSTDCFDCDFLVDSESCYENINSSKNYSSSFLVNSKECINCSFLFGCSNCQNCFMSSNLRNKQYVFRNQQLKKEEYEKRINEMDLGRLQNLQKFSEEFEDLKMKAIRKFANILKSTNVTGDEILESKNVQNSFRILHGENLKHCWRIADNFKDSYDVSGSLDSELVYEGSVAADHNYLVKFYSQFKNGKNCDYCFGGSSNSNLFACIGLKNKQYCILNKQYSKEEYEELVPKIVEHMNSMPYVDKQGRIYKYGEFFPPELSPFCYNETIAQEYFPLTKDEAIKQGYSWKDPEKRSYEITIKSSELPDHIKDVSEDIVGKVIECSHKGECNEQCTEAFKIIPQELQFYKRMNLPLPRLCPNCRHYSRLKQRNPLKLWKRKCMNTPCQNEFETSYSPDRKEIIYCEQCYNKEVV